MTAAPAPIPTASLSNAPPLDPDVQRKGLHEVEKDGYAKLPPLADNLEEFWIDIPLSDSWLSRTLVVRPKSATADSFGWSPRIRSSQTPKRPLIVHFHGGGFKAGSPLHMAHPARLFAQHFNATVLCPSYRLVPEYPWPTAMKDGMELIQLISSQSHLQYGANLAHGFIVGGASAGGGIAAIVAGLTSNDPIRYPLLRPLTGAFISIAILLVDTIVPPEYKTLWTSRHDNRDAEYTNTADMQSIVDSLVSGEDDLSSPWFSPVNLFTGPDSASATYPPTYLQAAGLDPLRDDTIVFEKILAAHNVPTKIDVFPDDPHNTLSTFNFVFGTRSKNPTIEEGTMAGIAWLLETVSQNGNGNGNGNGK